MRIEIEAGVEWIVSQIKNDALFRHQNHLLEAFKQVNNSIKNSNFLVALALLGFVCRHLFASIIYVRRFFIIFFLHFIYLFRV